jgi:uncharacterized membrane protein
MASNARRPDSGTWPKYAFFALVAVCFLAVVAVDELFWFDSADPHYQRVVAFRTLLMLHGLAGLTALTTGTLQMSSRIRTRKPALHRTLGRIYLAAVCLSAPIAIYIGTSALEPASIHVEQVFQGGFWLLSALVAWACIRSGQMPLHKAWMMRSYAFTLVFITSRVPDLFISHYSDQLISDILWALVVVGLIAPETILTTQALLRIRNAKARQARAVEA